MFIILPATELAEELAHLVDSDIRGGRLPDFTTYVASLDPALWQADLLKQCQALIQRMFDTALSMRMRWADVGGDPEGDLIRQWELWKYLKLDSYLQKEMVDEIYTQWIDPIQVKIGQILIPYVPERTWDIWYMRPLKGDILLEKGVDWRVADWTRRLEAGEFKHG